jgi:hypothetical protein
MGPNMLASAVRTSLVSLSTLQMAKKGLFTLPVIWGERFYRAEISSARTAAETWNRDSEKAPDDPALQSVEEGVLNQSGVLGICKGLPGPCKTGTNGWCSFVESIAFVE